MARRFVPETISHRTSWVRTRKAGDDTFRMTGRCSCGWKGEPRATPREAAEDCVEHLEDEGMRNA